MGPEEFQRTGPVPCVERDLENPENFFRISKFQFQNFKFQNFKISKLQNFKISKFRTFGLSDFRTFFRLFLGIFVETFFIGTFSDFPGGHFLFQKSFLVDVPIKTSMAISLKTSMEKAVRSAKKMIHFLIQHMWLHNSSLTFGTYPPPNLGKNFR